MSGPRSGGRKNRKGALAAGGLLLGRCRLLRAASREGEKGRTGLVCGQSFGVFSFCFYSFSISYFFNNFFILKPNGMKFVSEFF